MRSHLTTLAVAAVITLAVGLLSAVGWPGYLIGAALALSLWVMLLCGSSLSSRHGAVGPKMFAGAAVLAVGLGYVLFLFGDHDAGWWAPGFIVAGAMTFARPGATTSDRAAGVSDGRG